MELLSLMRSIYFRDFFATWMGMILELSHSDESFPARVLGYVIRNGFDHEWPAYPKELAQVQCLEELLRHYLVRDHLVIELLGFLLTMVRKGSMRPMIEQAMIVKVLCGQLNPHSLDHHIDFFNQELYSEAQLLLIEISSHLLLHRRSELPPRVQQTLVSFVRGWELEWDAMVLGDLAHVWQRAKMVLVDSLSSTRNSECPSYKLGYAGKDPRQVVAMANRRLQLESTRSTISNTSTSTSFSDDDFSLSSLCLDSTNQ